MKLTITAKPKAKKEYIKRLGVLEYAVAVHEPPVGGRANAAILKSLAKYFRKPVSQLRITSGETARKKIIEVPVTQAEVEATEDARTPQRKLL